MPHAAETGIASELISHLPIIQSLPFFSVVVSEITVAVVVYSTLAPSVFLQCGGRFCLPYWPWKQYQLGPWSLVGSTALGRFWVKGKTNCNAWPGRELGD